MGPSFAFGSWQGSLTTELVSVATDGTQANDWSSEPDVSDDGRFVAFQSRADNLAPGDNNGWRYDIYYRDRVTGETTLVSESRPGGITDRGSRSPSISDDGRYVAFFTRKDLDDADNNNAQDLYIWDADTGVAKWAEVTMDGSGAGGGDPRSVEPQLSGNGRYLVFDSKSAQISAEDGNGTRKDIFIYDMQSEETTLVTKPRAGASDWDRGSRSPSISDDGRYVVFFSGQDLVAEDDNHEQDLYLKDMQTGEFKLLDIWMDGGLPDDDVWDIRISGNGEYVVFETDEPLVAGATGRDTVYLFDIADDELVRLATPWSGATEVDRGARDAALSDDGRYVSFFTGIDVLPGDTNREQDLYVWDRLTDTYTRHDFYDSGRSPGSELEDFAMSGDGEWIAFASENSDLVPGDTNGEDDIFISRLTPYVAPGSMRYAGADRYATAVEVSKASFPDGANTAVIATGANWPDALAGSGLAGAVNGPILLTRPGTLPVNVKAELERLDVHNVYILGGIGAISMAVETELEALCDGFVNRLGGVDRYATAKLVADKAIAVNGWDGTILVATGTNFADALAGAPLAAGLDWPIVLASPRSGSVYMPKDTQRAVILGGTGAVPASVETMLKNTSLSNNDVVRLGGATRYDTAAMVAEYGVESGGLLWNGVGIATGAQFPDGLTGGAAVGMMRSTLLLTPTDSLAAPARTKLTDNKDQIDAVRFIGGTGAVGAGVEAEVKSILGM